MVIFFAIIEDMNKEVHIPITEGTIKNFIVIDPAAPDVPHYMEGSPIGGIEPVEGDPENYEGRAFVAETVIRDDGRTIKVGRIATISYNHATRKGSVACTPAYVGPPKPNMPQSRKRA